MKRILLSCIFLLAVALSGYGAPITAELLITSSPHFGEYVTALAVHGPLGDELHYLDWNEPVGSSSILVSQTGKIALSIDWDLDPPTYYILEHPLGPGVYGSPTIPSSGILTYHFPTYDTIFAESIRQRYRLDYVNLGPTWFSMMNGMDKHGNVYGNNGYGGVFGGMFDDLPEHTFDLSSKEEFQTWKNFQPYPIPEPSSAVLISVGLCAFAMGRSALKGRRS